LPKQIELDETKEGSLGATGLPWPEHPPRTKRAAFLGNGVDIVGNTAISTVRSWLSDGCFGTPNHERYDDLDDYTNSIRLGNLNPNSEDVRPSDDYLSDHWHEDLVFGDQRLTGMNVPSLTRVKKLPTEFQVTDAMISASCNQAEVLI